MSDTASTLDETVGLLIERMQLLQEAMQSQAGIADEGLTAAASQVQALVEQTQHAGMAVNDRADRVIDALTAFPAAVTEATDEAAQSVDTLLQDIDELLESAEQELSSAREGFETAAGDVTDAMESFAEEFRVAAEQTLFQGLQQSFGRQVEEADDAHRDAVTALVANLEETVGDLLDHLVEAMGSVRESLTAAIDDSEQQRMLTQPALDAVKTVLDPLFEQVSRLTDLADSLGISI